MPPFVIPANAPVRHTGECPRSSYRRIPPFVIPANAPVRHTGEYPRSSYRRMPVSSLILCRQGRHVIRMDAGSSPAWRASYAEGCQPASAHNWPDTIELEIMKQIASAISSGRISLLIWVSGRTWFSIYSSPSARTMGVSVYPG